MLDTHFVEYFDVNWESEFNFMQDTVPICTACNAKKILSMHDILFMDWPVQSPDLNPNDWWGMTKQKLRNQYRPDLKLVGGVEVHPTPHFVPERISYSMRDFIFLVFNFEVFNVLIFCE